MPWTLKQPLAKRPPEGIWRAEQDGFIFEGESPEEVAEKLESYRVRHGHVKGNAYQDVVDYNCNRYPHLGRWREGEAEQKLVAKNELDDSLWNKLWGLVRERKGYEHIPEHRLRQQTCQDCPYNAILEINEESQEYQDYKRMSMIITSGAFNHNPKLGVCAIHGHDNRIAVWLKHPVSQKKEEQPEYCWVD